MGEAFFSGALSAGHIPPSTCITLWSHATSVDAQRSRRGEGRKGRRRSCVRPKGSLWHAGSLGCEQQKAWCPSASQKKEVGHTKHLTTSNVVLTTRVCGANMMNSPMLVSFSLNVCLLGLRFAWKANVNRRPAVRAHVCVIA